MRPPSPSVLFATHFSVLPSETAHLEEPVTGPPGQGAMAAPLAFPPPDYRRQDVATMPPAYFAARDAPIPQTQSARVRESNSLDALHVMMAMFQAQTEAFERLRARGGGARSARAARGARARRARVSGGALERAERTQREEREYNRTFQRELLSGVLTRERALGSGLLEAARPEVSCSGVESAQSDGLLQPTARSSDSSAARLTRNAVNMAAQRALLPTSHNMAGGFSEPAPTASSMMEAGVLPSLSGSGTPVSHSVPTLVLGTQCLPEREEKEEQPQAGPLLPALSASKVVEGAGVTPSGPVSQTPTVPTVSTYLHSHWARHARWRRSLEKRHTGAHFVHWT